MSMMRMPSKGRVMIWAPGRFGDRVLGWLCYGRGAPSPSIRPIEIYGIGWISAGLAVAAPHSAPYIPGVSIVAGERSKNGTGYGRRLRRQGPQPLRAGPPGRPAGA